VDLGLSRKRFWRSTPREISALYYALAVKEGRWRFFIATSMGSKHKSGRPLELKDFLPPDPVRPISSWQEQIDATRVYMAELSKMQGQVTSSSEKING
jgi:hypothetical protein